ncbi:hypothetical protein LDENG_00158940 [Lucifuga dentata]|nr:hypothetical protein LDENG_00158940 [Lucifuga dentata]
MIRNHEEDEFIAVRVQDPRIQHEGLWNSHVDYKIFLHTNSKAFTAKTSCVRRRYSEFVWLKKKLQKNAGLVPVPDLPGKSLFFFSNEDFLEKRRKGLQVFLDKVVHMTVCLSDSQLHLFLQTQLPVGHIEDCVQGHTPYTVTDAILTYASSNRGLAQAQEDDMIKEPSSNAVSYESMESPAPHQPHLCDKDTATPELLSSADINPTEDEGEVCDQDSATLQLSRTEKPSLRVLQNNDHLEAVVEHCRPSEAIFFLGDNQDDVSHEWSSFAEQTHQTSCQIQTPVDVHSPVGTGFEDSCEAESVFKESSTVTEDLMALETERKTNLSPPSGPCPDTQETADQWNSLVEVNVEEVSCEEDGPEKSVMSDSLQKHAASEDSGSEEQLAALRAKLHVSCPEKPQNLSGQTDKVQSEELESTNEMVLQSTVHKDTHKVHSVPEVQYNGNDTIPHIDTQLDQINQEVDLVKTINKEDSNDESQLLSSSSGSTVRVSDEESVCDEAEIQNANGYMMTSPKENFYWLQEASSRTIREQMMNGYLLEQESSSDAQEETNGLRNTKKDDLE